MVSKEDYEVLELEAKRLRFLVDEWASEASARKLEYKNCKRLTEKEMMRFEEELERIQADLSRVTTERDTAVERVAILEQAIASEAEDAVREADNVERIIRQRDTLQDIIIRALWASEEDYDTAWAVLEEIEDMDGAPCVACEIIKRGMPPKPTREHLLDCQALEGGE